MTHFELVPRGPFSLEVENSYFGGWASTGGDAGRIVLTFPVEGWRTSAAVTVAQAADGRVIADVYGAQGEDAEQAWKQAQAALSLDFDGSGYAEIGKRDPVLGKLQHEHHFLRPVCFHSPYEAASAFVIGHRISVAQQRALRNRLAREHGDAVTVGGETFHAFPRPQVLLDLDAFGQIAGEKMERLHGLAEAALAGRLDRDRLRSMPVEEALTELRGLRGVGDFTGKGTLLRGAGLVDAMPDDEVTRQAIQHFYGLGSPPSNDEMFERAEAWRPYRMWASVLLHAAFRRSGVSYSATQRGRSERRSRR